MRISSKDLFAVVNTWYLMTLFACLLITVSTIMKIVSDYIVSAFYTYMWPRHCTPNCYHNNIYVYAYGESITYKTDNYV